MTGAGSCHRHRCLSPRPVEVLGSCGVAGGERRQSRMTSLHMCLQKEYSIQH